MPESVDRPAPVSTTRGRVASRSRADAVADPASRVTGWSPGVPELGPRLGLGRLDLAVLRGCGGHQVLEQVLGQVGDLADRAVERRLVGLRRLRGAAHLAHVL